MQRVPHFLSFTLLVSFAILSLAALCSWLNELSAHHKPALTNRTKAWWRMRNTRAALRPCSHTPSLRPWVPGPTCQGSHGRLRCRPMILQLASVAIVGPRQECAQQDLTLCADSRLRIPVHPMDSPQRPPTLSINCVFYLFRGMNIFLLSPVLL